MIRAGHPVDGHKKKGDTIIDGGNSDYRILNVVKTIAGKGIFL